MEIPLDDVAFRDRFWSHVDQESGEWTGCTDRDGYGIFTAAGPGGERVKYRAHRVAWAVTHRTQPTPVIRHDCDHPPCCRPDHLLPGTQADNVRDRDEPDRRSRRARRRREQAGQTELALDDCS